MRARLRHRIPMIGACSSVLQLRLQRLPVSRHRPDVLGKCPAQLLACQTTPDAFPQQAKRFVFIEYPYLIALRLVGTGSSGRSRSEIARALLALGIASVTYLRRQGFELAQGSIDIDLAIGLNRRLGMKPSLSGYERPKFSSYLRSSARPTTR